MKRLHLLIAIILALAVLATGAYFVRDALYREEPPSARDDPPDETVITEPPEPEPLDCTVGLYTGGGSWDVDREALQNFLAENELEYVEIDRERVSSSDLHDHCDILVFVGGWSAEYLHCIENHANIRSFVERGGRFVGFCAGAYYASTTMVWRGQSHEYPLGLFPGEARGPDLQWGTLSTVALNREIDFQRGFPATMEMWYFDGPYFTGFPDSDVDVLARYEANGEAAVIAFPFGRGRVLLLGPHPELGYIAAEDLVLTEGGGGAQWPWLYGALQWLMGDRPV